MFSGVTSNIGSSFQLETSSFLCPVTGVYYFSLNLLSIAGYHLRGNIVKENEVLGSTYSDASYYGYHQGGTTAVITCERGQSVWVQSGLNNIAIDYTADARYSSFSGFLLHAL